MMTDPSEPAELNVELASPALVPSAWLVLGHLGLDRETPLAELLRIKLRFIGVSVQRNDTDLEGPSRFVLTRARRLTLGHHVGRIAPKQDDRLLEIEFSWIDYHRLRVRLYAYSPGNALVVGLALRVRHDNQLAADNRAHGFTSRRLAAYETAIGNLVGMHMPISYWISDVLRVFDVTVNRGLKTRTWNIPGQPPYMIVRGDLRVMVMPHNDSSLFIEAGLVGQPLARMEVIPGVSTLGEISAVDVGVNPADMDDG
jgi:hypothetical protein